MARKTTTKKKKPTGSRAVPSKTVEVTKSAVPEGTKRRNRSDGVNQQALRAVVIPIRKDLPDPSVDVEKALASTSVAEDPFVGLSHQGNIIEPPFDLLTLAMLEEQNTELTPILETMEANIDGFGHHLVQLHMPGKPNDAMKKAIHVEKVRLTNFFNYANIKDSFIKLRKKRRKDYEATGNAYWEVIRSASNQIQGFEHVPSYQIRLGKLEQNAIKVDVPTLQLQEDGSHKVVNITTWTRYRRFVQSRLTIFRGITAESGGYKTRWFKEFGDPRTYDNTTGDLIGSDKVKNFGKNGEPMPESRKANELIHWRNYSTRSPYGLPRFIGNLLSIFGSRAAEEINYTTFRNNNIPSMVVLVSNGQLTDGSIGRIESFVESQVAGSDNYSKFLIIEAEGMLEGEDAGQIKMEIKPLTQHQVKDALFQNYQKNNQSNVRRAFRLPPIFVGKCHSDDTEYLTERGWEVYGAIDDGVQLGTLNRETGALEYQLPSKRYAYDYSGELLHIHNRGVDAMVTPNHGMWTRPHTAKSRSQKPWCSISAADLGDIRGGNGGYLELPVSAAWEGKRVDTFTIPAPVRKNARDPNKPSKNLARDTERYASRVTARDVPMQAFLRFLGYFVAEGSTTDVRGPVTLSQNAGEVADDMLAVLRELGFTPGVTESRPGELKIDVCHEGLWSWLREHCGHGSASKRFPSWSLDLVPAQIEEMLRCAVAGDGHEPALGSAGAFSYATTSKILADQMHEIGVKLGYAVTSRTEVYETSNGVKVKWCLYAHADKRHLVHPVRQIRRAPYEGKVSCFTVPNGMLVTRRNGRVLISGNSDDYTKATADTSRRLADEQVFAPERDEFDEDINRLLFPAMGIRYHRFKSNSPNTTDNSELVKILSGAEKTGGMTPTIARLVLQDILGMELPEFPEDDRFDPNLPFSLIMAEAVKNQGDPSEPGQTVTALKRLQDLGFMTDDDPFEPTIEEIVVQKLNRMRKSMEADWEGQVVEAAHDAGLDLQEPPL